MPSLMRYINVISRCGAVWRGDKLKDTDWFKNNRTCPDAWKSKDGN